MMLAGDQRRAREFVLWGATRRAARLGTDWCSFPSEHCPVVTMSGVSCGRKARRVAPGRETGSRRLNQTLSGLHSTLKCRPSHARAPRPSRSAVAARVLGARTSACPRGRAPLVGSSRPRQSVTTSPWLSPTCKPESSPGRLDGLVETLPRTVGSMASPRRPRRTHRRRGARSGRSRGRRLQRTGDRDQHLVPALVAEVSLSALKPSMSPYSTTTGRPERLARLPCSGSITSRPRRLRSPVSSSCSESSSRRRTSLWRSRCRARWTARPVPRRPRSGWS